MNHEEAIAYLGSLLAKRSNWIEATRENQFEEGIQRLLSDLYPDQAHFVFEILQNAEDAKATEVHFQLQLDRLVVSHNGARQFTQRDVDSITSIGKSTKRDDVNQIGKFGVGFKAVFAYTTTPSVVSGPFAFEIRNLVCPHPLQQPFHSPLETKFVFPFNASKAPAQCFREVADWLNGMGDNTLLFLRNIKVLSWEIAGKGKGKLERIEPRHELTEIQRTLTGHTNPERTYWLRFLKPLRDAPEQFVSLAFRLAFLNKDHTRLDADRPLAEQVRIVPLSTGQLSIFFPAERETTKLKFHLHGPYASTVARDSIPHRADNQGLLQLTAQLLSESLETVKVLNLLTSDFLEVLPNPGDELAPFYVPLLEEVVATLQSRPLVPVDKGGHAPARELLLGPASIRSVIGNADMAFYTGYRVAGWAAGVMQGQRAEKLLRALEMSEWGWSDLLRRTQELFAVKDVSDYELQWLAKRDDEWMQSYYALLGELLAERFPWELRYNVGSPEEVGKGWRVICTTDGKIRTGAETFFRSEMETTAEPEFPAVRQGILQGAKKRQVEAARKFLELVGVRTVGEKERIQSILATHYSKASKLPEWSTHVDHLRRFISWWSSSKETELFHGAFLFLDETEKLRITPGVAYLDFPFCESGLKSLITSGIWPEERRHMLSPRYAEAKLEGFAVFVAHTGGMTSLPIVTTPTWQNPNCDLLRRGFERARETEYAIDSDFTIKHLQTLLAAKKSDVSKAVWNAVRTADPKILKARYRPNSNYDVREADSQLVCALRTSAWIPTKSGGFQKPALVTCGELPADFTFDDRNGWLRAIGFGSGTTRGPQETKAIELAAKTLGIAPDLAKQLDELTSDERAEVESLIRDTVGKVRAKRKSKSSPDAGPPQQPDNPAKSADQKEQISPNAGATPVDPQKALAGAFSRPGKTQLVPERPRPGPLREERIYRERTRSKYQSRKREEPAQTERKEARIVEIWEPKNNAIRDFFINEYGGSCQICEQTFPRRSDGSPYFEAVYLISHTAAAWTDEPGGVLCLCAQCSAKFQHGAVESENAVQDLRSLKIESESGQSPRLSIKLVGEAVSIRFTDRHLVEIQELLRSTEDNAPATKTDRPGSLQTPAGQSVGAKPPLVQCPQCPAQVREDNLQGHLRKAHGPNRPTTTGALPRRQRSEAPTNFGKCRACGKPAIPGEDYCYSCQ